MTLNRKWRDKEAPSKLERSGWKEQEAAGADALPKGKRVRGSGSGTSAHKRSDAYNDAFRQEAKTTGNKTLPIEREWLEAIEHQASTTGRQPMLVFGFDADAVRDPHYPGPDSPTGDLEFKTRLRPRLDWGAFPLRLAKRLLEVYDAVRDGDFKRASEAAELIPRRNGR